MLKLLFLSLLTASVTVCGSHNRHLPVLARNVPAPKVVRNLVVRQDCSPGYVSCGSGCMPSDAVCCGDSGHCDAGEFCWVGGRFCCLPGYVECGVGCMPPDSACCNAEGVSCPAGNYCVPNNLCCSLGQTCEGSTTYLAGTTLTGPTGPTSTPTTPTATPTTTPSSIAATTSQASTAVVSPTITTPSVATFTGGAVPGGPDVYAAIVFAAGQILL